MKKFIAIFALFVSSPAFAENAASSTQPVEISAQKSLEWNRKAKTYTARENVIVKQGAVQIQSDALTAHYTDENGMADISTLVADHHVVITSPPYTSYGDRAVYDVKSSHATLTGEDLRILAAEDVLTAKDKIEFFGAENKLSATGGATATHGRDVLLADAMNAFFSKDAEGKMTADKITANGHVTIKTEKETATGDSGVYDLKTQKAVLTGKVRILQGQNWLEGTRADVDMVSGISQLSGSGNAATGGRVKGVFYPKAGEILPGKANK